MKNDSIVNKPYLERQLLIVSEKEVIAAAEEETRRREAQDTYNNSSRLEYTGAMIKRALSFSPQELAITSIKEFKAWNKARQNSVSLLPISRQQAEKLSFPPGHPREGIVYVGHPCIPNIYYTIADFHRYMFEHKLSEAIEILMSLGATSIRAEHRKGWARDFSAKISVPISTQGENVDAEASASSRAEKSVLFTATLAGNNDPKLPRHLVWFNHEPTWQTIAQGRLNHGLADFSMSLFYVDDFGINVGIKTSLTKAGLDLGGTFEGHEATRWELTGTFGPVAATHSK